MTIELDKNKEQELREAFRCLIALSQSAPVDNHSTCGVFHIQPFNNHWDSKTVSEIKYHLNLYINTWVIPKLSNALGFDEGIVVKEMLMNWHKTQADRIKREIENNKP